VAWFSDEFLAKIKLLSPLEEDKRPRELSLVSVEKLEIYCCRDTNIESWFSLALYKYI